MAAALIDIPHPPAINMIALAAPQLRSNERNRAYSRVLLKDLFNNAYAADRLVKEHDRMEHKQTRLSQFVDAMSKRVCSSPLKGGGLRFNDMFSEGHFPRKQN